MTTCVSSAWTRTRCRDGERRVKDGEAGGETRMDGFAGFAGFAGGAAGTPNGSVAAVGREGSDGRR